MSLALALAWKQALTPATAAGPPEHPAFVDVAALSGLVFTHDNGMTGQRYFCEIMGPGAGLLDADGDGDWDAYLVQGGPLTGASGTAPGDRLFRNEAGRFADVTDAAGITATGYGMGVAVGDASGDGRVDLFVTNFGANQLWTNRGGEFVDASAATGETVDAWSTSAAFVDYDRDGHLDLFVGNYVDYRLATHRPCFSAAGVEDYCSPLSFAPVPNRLLRNRGDGTFADVSAATGIAAVYGGALGVLVLDADADGWPDLYVANDGRPNQLWMNGGGHRFTDDALFSGTAVNDQGAAEASMGVDAGDFDGDGDEDLFMTHLDRETNTLYRNADSGFYEDRTFATGLGLLSKGHTGFGTAFLDVDNDGWLDLFVANGAVLVDEAQALAGDPLPLRQPDQLLRNRGDGTYDLWPEAGADVGALHVSRGVAVGDVDDDGDADLLVAANGGPARLLRNQLGQASAWIGLRLVDARGRDAYGAEAVVHVEGRRLLRTVRAAASYCSSRDPRLLVGLGAAHVDAVEVRWPDGSTQSWPGQELSARRYHVLRRGGGSAPP